MGYNAEQLLQTALGEAGYLEKRSSDMLNEKTANAGAGNYTKYARDLHQAGYYNGSKQGVSWCSVFVDWCHYVTSGKQREMAQQITCQTGVYGASCTYSMGYYQAAGRFDTGVPKPGDQIYFGIGKTAEHTGIVWKVENGRVYTVEGNTASQEGVISNGGGVFCKSYPLNHSRILGYGKPRYTNKSLSPVTVRRGDRGEPVKALQHLLIGNRCDCGKWGADGNFGAATESAVLAYQAAHRLSQDGVAGPETWGSLLGIA